jgi:hypothetical protein
MCIQIGMMDSKLPVRLHARALMPFSIRPFHRLPLTYFLAFSSLMSMLLLGSGLAYAEWVRLTEADGMTVHFDPDTIRRNGNLVKIWLLYDYKTAITTGRDTVFSTKMQSEYDCIGERVRTNAIFEIAGNMGKGKVVSSSLAGGQWIPIAPETIGKREWKLACAK